MALFVWVLLPSNKKSFDDAANLPFEEDGFDPVSAQGNAGDNDRRET
ncbi:MAG: hypothetical protein OFPI_23810 [Osedax symbiont Rs2]|nr:MAG: hypothetical protein OFPI_23810 [Osedax symbiont Rs2]